MLHDSPEVYFCSIENPNPFPFGCLNRKSFFSVEQKYVDYSRDLSFSQESKRWLRKFNAQEEADAGQFFYFFNYIFLWYAVQSPVADFCQEKWAFSDVFESWLHVSPSKSFWLASGAVSVHGLMLHSST